MKGISIKVKSTGRYLDVPGSIKFKIKQVNNIFFDAKHRRSYSMNIGLPKTPRNNIELDWLYDIAADNASTTEIDVAVFDRGAFVFNAIMKVRKTNTRYLCHLLLDYGTIDVNNSDTELRDIPAFDDPSHEITTGNSGDFPADITSFYFHGFNYQKPLNEESLNDNFYTNTAGYYLNHVIREVLNHSGWKGDSMSGTFMNDAELQQLHFFNFYDIPGLNVSDYTYVSLLPRLSVKDMFESLSIMFGANLFFDNGDKSVRLELLKTLLHKSPVDWSRKVVRVFERNWGTPVLRGIEFKWDDPIYAMYERPDMDTSEDLGWWDNETFLLAQDGTETGDLVRVVTDNTAFVWEKATPLSSASWYPKHYLGHIMEIDMDEVIGTYLSRFQLPAGVVGDIAFCEHENWFYIHDGDDWRRHSFNNHSLKVGDGSRKLVSKIGSPIVDQIGDDLHDAKIRSSPVIVDYGLRGSNLDGDTKNHWNDLPALLMFNRGTGYDDDGNPYFLGNSPATPWNQLNFSSPDIYDASFNQVGNYRLSWGTDNGLFKQFHEDWYNYVKNGQEVVFMASLTIVDLINLDFSVPVHIHGATGFIREIEYELPLLEPVKVTMVKF